jgi:REP element-mobilizing transposase RayT
MHDEPLAYFITWTCFGTWLPGDERGWTKWHMGDQVHAPHLVDWVRERLSESPVTLDGPQRQAVEEAIVECCRRRGWTLHAVNCRSNHCHVVVTAVDYEGETVRDQLKAWSTRRLRDLERASGVPENQLRQNWWTRNGSIRYLDSLESLEAAIRYTNDAQDAGGSKQNE